MEAQSPRSRIGGSWTGQILASRRGALTVAAITAILAGALFYLFVQHYKKTAAPVTVAPANVYVFVAGKYIPKGTPAETIDQQGLLRRTQVAAPQAVSGAITDPSEIAGEVSTSAIAAGQQITAADFTRANVSLGAYLTGNQRAIALNLDPTHGLSAYIASGSSVDVMFDVASKVTMLAQNVPVLENTAGIIVVRVTDKVAMRLADAEDNAKIWLLLRAPNGATQSVNVGSTAGL